MNFWPVYKRELRSYFTSPIAYVVLLFFMLLTGIFFMLFISDFSMASMQQSPYGAGNLNVTMRVIRPLLGNMSVIMLFVMPLITMKPFAEERKSGTMELLFTYPLTDMDVVLGKFFAAFTLFLVMLGLTLIYPLFMFLHSKPEAGTLITGYLGLLLMAASFMSLGLFISSLTENQIIAAIGTFAGLLIFWVINFWVSSSAVLRYLSLLEHFNNFAEGVIDTRDLVYYLSFTVLWLFMTLRVLESKKWRS
jgi:ABC-2 type transport system permease protein